MDNIASRLHIVRVHCLCDQYSSGFVFLICSYGHQHRFSQATGTVIHRGIGYIHCRQRGHHRLILVNQLQRALAGFCLIRRIGGHELASGSKVPYRRRDMVVITPGTDKAGIALILLRPRGHKLQHRQFAAAFRHRIKLITNKICWNFIKQRVDIGNANLGQHFCNICFGMRDKGHGFS